MESRDVILFFKWFDEQGRADELRRLYRDVLPVHIARLQPRMLALVEEMFGENGAPEVDAAILDLPTTIGPLFTILTTNGELNCIPRFGWYDGPRDAIIMWLEPIDPTEDSPTTFDVLFNQPPSDTPTVGIRYYLVFSLRDIRGGRVVDTAKGKVMNGQPEHLSVGEREEIFAAAGYPMPEPK